MKWLKHKRWKLVLSEWQRCKCSNYIWTSPRENRSKRICAMQSLQTATYLFNFMKALALRSIDDQRSIDASYGQPRLWLDCTNVQVNLSFHSTNKAEYAFSSHSSDIFITQNHEDIYGFRPAGFWHSAFWIFLDQLPSAGIIVLQTSEEIPKTAFCKQSRDIKAGCVQI